MKFSRGQLSSMYQNLKLSILFSLLLGNKFKRNNMIKVYEDIYLRMFVEAPFIEAKI